MGKTIRQHRNEDGDTLTIRKPRIDVRVDYANEALWTCFDKVRKTNHLVRGPLAQILMKYPEDYTLKGPYCWMEFVDEPTQVVEA